MGIEQLKIYELERIAQWSMEGGNPAKAREAQAAIVQKYAAIRLWKPCSPERDRCPDCLSNSGCVDLEVQEQRHRRRLLCSKCGCHGPWVRIRVRK